MIRKLPVLVVLLALAACGGGSGSEGSRTLIQNKGSDTLVTVAQAWAEAYKEVDPAVAVAVSGGGTGTGISAMINGTVDIANASRKMKEDEIAAATANGHRPIEFVVGFDALAIYLHHDNPLEAVTLAQLAEVYGDGGTIETWSQLGVSVPGCDSDEIIRISRQNNSGTYVYFQEAVLQERDFKLGSRDMHGSKDVVDLVMNTPCAIGYSGIAYAIPEVRTVPVKMDDAAPAVAPSEVTAIDGTYPIARPLFMYTAGEPQGAIKAYMDWILSDAGQCVIQEKGYAPVRPVACP